MATAPQTATTATTNENSGKATAALILGIVTLVLCWFPFVPLVTGAIGIALGYTARSDIKSRGLSGMGLANTGIALSIVGAALFIAFLIIGFATS